MMSQGWLKWTGWAVEECSGKISTLPHSRAGHQQHLWGLPGWQHVPVKTAYRPQGTFCHPTCSFWGYSLGMCELPARALARARAICTHASLPGGALYPSRTSMQSCLCARWPRAGGKSWPKHSCWVWVAGRKSQDKSCWKHWLPKSSKQLWKTPLFPTDRW